MGYKDPFYLINLRKQNSTVNNTLFTNKYFDTYDNANIFDRDIHNALHC